MSIEGVLAAYAVTRKTFELYKKGIETIPFLRRFVAALMTGSVPHLKLNTDRSPGQGEYRAHIAGFLNTWDKAVRVPFLGHLSQLLFAVFEKTEPIMQALLLLTKPPQ